LLFDRGEPRRDRCGIEALKREAYGKGVRRFISTHPDEDHYRGIEYLDAMMVTAHPPGQNPVTSPMPADRVADELMGRHGAIEPSG
jgi:hypothetical protein